MIRKMASPILVKIESPADLPAAIALASKHAAKPGRWGLKGDVSEPIVSDIIAQLNSKATSDETSNWIGVGEQEGFVQLPTTLASFAVRATKPTMAISSLLKAQSSSSKEASKLGLALVARGCFFSNLEAFELLESLVDGLVANNNIVEMMEGFAGTAFPVESPFIAALRQGTSLPYSSCVALGTVKEAEVARAMDGCAPALVGRLSRLLKELGLPNKFDRKTIDTTAVRLAFAQVAKVNNAYDVVECILPSGTFALSQSSRIPFNVVERVLSDALSVVPFNLTESNKACSVRVPGSKSVSNRALLLAGLSKGTCVVRGLLHSDDTQVMMGALEQLGASFTWIENGAALLVKGNGGVFAEPKKPLWMGNAGTATRFVISLCCLVENPNHETLLEGSHRMEERPQGDLTDALVANGCHVSFKKRPGYLPLAMRGGGFKGGKMTLSGKISSQYVSSVLFAAPYAKEPLELTLAEAEPTSIAYIEMTLDTMREFGVEVKRLAKNQFLVPNNTGGYKCPPEYLVEADASSATYALAFASVTPGRSVTVLGVGSHSLQGDAEFCQFLGKMGSTVAQTLDSTTVTGPDSLHAPHEVDGSIDMANLTDAFLTGVACAVMTPEGTTTKIVGIENQHVKECDRIAALVKELGKLGVSCDNLPDGIVVRGRGPSFLVNGVREPYLDTYDDHRVAMSLSVVGSRIPRLVISDKDCTDKTYPDFWDDLVNRLKTEVVASPVLPTSKSWLNQSLVLIGMRGAGKTTLGKKTAEYLGWSFLDLDDVLVEKTKMESCRAIVEKVGWQGFREMEYQVLCETLSVYPEKYVLACGGGVIEFPQSRERLMNYFPVVNIERDFADIDLVLNKGASASTSSSNPSPSKKLKQEEDDPNRPRFDEPIINVFTRRKPWFTQCSDFDFYAVRSGSFQALELDWPLVERDFVRLIENMRKPASPDSFVHDASMVETFVVDAMVMRPEEMKIRLAEIRRRDPVKLICIRLNEAQPAADVDHEIELLQACARTGCEGWIMPKRSYWKHSAVCRGRVLSAFGPVRLCEDPAEPDQDWFKSSASQYPGKAWMASPARRMYYLFGHPVYASPSPTMHNEGFRLLGHSLLEKRYTIFNTIDAQRVNACLKNSSTFAGCSVTIPHKQNIDCLGMVSSEAKTIGAVNTVVRTDSGELVGDNTDWIGIRNCLLYNGNLAPNSTVLVVGAGGTARAACFCVKALGLHLAVYNRTQAKAEELAKEFNGQCIKSSTEMIQNLSAIVSTVPATSKWTAPEQWLVQKPLVFDVAYRPRRTALLNQAAENGCFTVEGIDMLLEQGFEQVKRFEARSIDKTQLDQVKLTEEMKHLIKKEVFSFYDQ